MQFRQPHRVEAIALGGVDLVEGLREGVGLAAARHHRKLVKHAEFHRRFLSDRPMPLPRARHYFFASAYG